MRSVGGPCGDPAEASCFVRTESWRLAVAVHLASRLGARALIAERTFHLMVEIGAELYWWAPVRMFMRNRYPSVTRIADYDGRLLQMHGTADEIVPLDSARKLFEACPSEQKTFLEIEGMGHNDFAPRRFYEAMGSLLNDLAESGRDGNQL